MLDMFAVGVPRAYCELSRNLLQTSSCHPRSMLRSGVGRSVGRSWKSIVSLWYCGTSAVDIDRIVATHSHLLGKGCIDG